MERIRKIGKMFFQAVGLVFFLLAGFVSLHVIVFYFANALQSDTERYKDRIVMLEQKLSDLEKRNFQEWRENLEKKESANKEETQMIFQKIEEYYFDMKHTAENYVFTENKLRKIMKTSNPDLSESKIVQYIESIIKWSDKYKLSPIFVASVVHRETNFKEDSVSKAKARGALQVIYKYHKDKCDKLGIEEKGLHDIDDGINIGCQILREYVNSADGNYRRALYRYVGAVKNTKTAEGYVKDIFDMVVYAYS